MTRSKKAVSASWSGPTRLGPVSAGCIERSTATLASNSRISASVADIAVWISASSSRCASSWDSLCRSRVEVARRSRESFWATLEKEGGASGCGGGWAAAASRRLSSAS